MNKKYKIKKGSRVGQDFSFFEWEDDSIIFEIDPDFKHETRFCVKAPGYGIMGNYGNGAVFVNKEDLEEYQMNKKIVKKLITSDILHELEGGIDNAILFLQKIKNRQDYADFMLEVESYSDYNELRLYGLREETDEEMNIRLESEKRNMEREQEQRRRTYEMLKKEFENP